MRIKLSLVSDDGTICPVTVIAEGAATVAEVATSIQAGLTKAPTPADIVLSLQEVSDQGEVLDVIPPKSLLAETSLRSGQRVRVSTWKEGATTTGSSAPARLRILAGANAGESFPLPFGPSVIGRDEECDITLNDHLVSRKHARVTVSDKIEIIDLNSSNGVVLDDLLVDHAILGPRDVVILGGTSVMVEPSPELLESVGGTFVDVEFNRSPLVRAPYIGRQFQVPRAPARAKPSKLPLVAMAAPLLMGIVLFTMTHNMMSIIFVALSPIIAIGTYLDRRFTDKKTAQSDRAKFDQDMEDLRSSLTTALNEEHAARCAEVLGLGATLEAAFSQNPDLWHRHPEEETFLNIHVGYGRDRSRHEVRVPERGDADAATWEAMDGIRAQAEYVNDVPVVARLKDCGNVGICGPRDWVDPIARNVVAQIVCQHSPAEVVVAALASGESCERWEWLMWLPHVGSAYSPLSGPHLASTLGGVSALVSGLEELVAARHATTHAATVPAVVVLVENDAPVERGRLVGIAQKGPEVGVHMVWLADRQEQLPAACHVYLTYESQDHATAGFVTEEQAIDITRVEPLSAQVAEDMARRMSPIVDAGAPVIDQSDVPRSVSYLTLAEQGLASEAQVTVDRWKENGSLLTGDAPRSKAPATLKALVGQGAQGDFTLDLRTQGPHALVGGTTGAGKSEFLQSWVLGMATGHSPQRVTFLFVDYKGGSAFADCLHLPHTVGLVTDLSQHLVRRALTSLKAELQYREHLLNRKKAKDLLALERTGDPDCPPALIIVVDEFAALAKEVPDFVDGVVDVAQRGRSLGLHLILATQRPAGVITSNLRANTNLRVALRMADEQDSTDVIDTPLASQFDPRIPGRGAVRTGPGRIALFQTGYVGGHTSDVPEPTTVDVETMTFGPGIPWDIPDMRPTSTAKDEGPTDIARIVSMVRAAADLCGLPEPRKPWLPELSTSYDLAALPPPDLPGERIPLGMLDDPAHQAQHTVFYAPDIDGNLAIFGASGSGKSTVLRSLAYAAATARDFRTDIYGMDFSTAGLAMLESLPTVGAIVDGSDLERVTRLLNRLITTLDERSARYAKARAGSVTDYREATGQSDESRILLLVDGLSAFRDQYETASSTAFLFSQFTRLAAEGRAVGIHVILTAERPGAMPSSLSSAIQRRLVFRQADENAYLTLNIGKDILDPTSPPGRGVFSGDTNEVQIATPRAATSPADQGQAIDELAEKQRSDGVIPTPSIERLTEFVSLSALPARVKELPVIGVNEADLQPFTFTPQGGFVLTGMTGSGRTTALLTITQSLQRWDPDIPMYYIGPGRSVVANQPHWQETAQNPDDIKALAGQLKPLAEQPAIGDVPGMVLVIESINDLIQTPSEAPVTEVVKLLRRNGHLVIGEHEMSGWGASWPLLAEVRMERRGIVMQPDPNDGDILFKVPFPRVRRADYPPGRGVFAAGGKTWTVQLGFPQTPVAGK